MSASTSAPEAIPPVTLQVLSGTVAAEIFVVDHRLHLVARGAGSLTAKLPPGVYKIKVQAGRDVREKTILLVADELVRWDAPTVVSAAPSPQAARSHAYQIAGAAARSRRVDLQRGAGGSLFAMVRTFSVVDETQGPPRRPHPAKGLNIAAWDGTWRLDLSELAIEDASRDAWCAVNIAVDPGAYLLQSRAGDGSLLEQSITVSPGWQTQVFLLSQAGVPTTESPGGFGASDFGELLNATILMGKDGFAPDDWQFRLTESARVALADDRAVRTPELDDLLRYKFDNPMLGILGAHLLLLAHEEGVRQEAAASRRERLNLDRSSIARAQVPFDQELFDLVVGNLRRLVGDQHPDVQALWLRHTGATPVGVTRTPPMLARSWSLLVTGSLTWPSIVPFELWRHVAMRAATAPFLSWLRSTTDTSVLESFLDDLRREVTANPRAVADSMRSNGRYPEARAADGDQRDLSKVAADLGIPKAAAEWLSK